MKKIILTLIIFCNTAICFAQEAGTLEPIVVQSEYTESLLKPSKVKKEALQKVPGSMNDPLRALQTLPTITNSNDFDARLFIRGSAPEDSIILLDNFLVGYPFHFFGLSSTIPMSVIDHVQVYPGGFPVEFGNYMGGIIENTTAVPKKPSGNFYLQLNQAAFYYQTIFNENDYVQFSFRREFYDLLLANWEQAKQLPTNYDYLIKAKWADFKIQFFGSEDKASLFTYASESQPDNITEVYQASTNIGLSHDLSLGDVAITTKLFYLEDPQKYHIDDRNFFEQLPQSISFESLAKINLIPDHLLTIGLVATYEKPVINIKISDYFDSIDKYLSPGQELFNAQTLEYNSRTLLLSDRFSLNDKLLGYIGVRWDYNTLINRHMVSPRFQLSWQLDQINEINAACGLYAQEPEPINFSEFSTQNELNYNQAINYNVQYQADFGATKLSIEAFYKNMFVLSTITTNGAINFSGKGYNYGSELKVEQEWGVGDHSTTINYALSRSKRYLPSDDNWIFFDNDRMHQLTLSHSFLVYNLFHTALKWSYNTGQPFTSSPSQINDQRLPDYHRLDMRFWKLFNLKEIYIRTYLDIINVYNQENYSRLIFNNLYASQNYYVQFPLLVIAGIEIGF